MAMDTRKVGQTSSSLTGDCCCLVAQSCPTLCDPVVCIPPGSSARISQARILEWLAFPFSRGSS